jgi:hypothetical protein
MTTIKIDNQNYELETLSDEAKNQLVVSLQFVDALQNNLGNLFVATA